MAAYHKSNFGSFGGGLVCDMDGDTYTTAREWLEVAVVDGEMDAELAQEYADEANAALAKAEAAVEKWQDSNS